VKNAWARWLFALDALNGGRVRPTPAQRELRSKIAGRQSRYEDPIAAMRRWRREQPEARTDDAYDAWTRRVNENLAEGELLMPGSTVIRDALVIPFTEAVRVAEGEIELDDARLSTRGANSTWSSGPHDFINQNDIARITGKTRPQVATLIRQPDFPKAVLSVDTGDAWLREDVEAYAAGRPFTPREHNELRPLYLTAKEVAAARGVTPAALRQKNAAAPPRIGQINRTVIYYRPDVEEWLATLSVKMQRRRP
jgi:predicted DNA-binding transcriptional regulator AlpA